MHELRIPQVSDIEAGYKKLLIEGTLETVGQMNLAEFLTVMLYTT
jgi:hypothetical protein